MAGSVDSFCRSLRNRSGVRITHARTLVAVNRTSVLGLNECIQGLVDVVQRAPRLK